MIYELADYVQGFLVELNVPPSSSFHEEMLKNLRQQQELLALKEQERMDLQRRQEEQMVCVRVCARTCLFCVCAHVFFVCVWQV